MMYEFRYKCFIPGWYKRICYGLPKGMPLLYVDYRKEGGKRWAKGIEASLDWYASECWNEYYNGGSEMSSLDGRVYTFQSVLNDRYHGDLTNYVRAMTEYVVMSEQAGHVSKDETNALALSFVTNGWKTGKVEVAEWR